MKRLLISLVIVYLLGLVVIMLWPAPQGVSVAGPERSVPAGAVTFLADRTYVDADGIRHTDHEIFDEVIRMIHAANEYVLVDMFLYNSFQGTAPEHTRALASELTGALVAAKEARPDLAITVVSDPLNTVYGGAVSPEFTALSQSGIPVILTDLTKLRDSNPLYSVLWRGLFQWFGNSPGGLATHPFAAEGDDVSLRSWLSLLNFKANHRKLIVADETDSAGVARLATLVTSANPHDGSSAHSNIAIKVTGDIGLDVIASERATALFSGAELPPSPQLAEDTPGNTTVQLVTEEAVRDRIVSLIRDARGGDAIDVAMFYLADRTIVTELASASRRGATIRLILDANKDAFGHSKIGVPNRPVAHELRKKGSGIQVRWCDTHGEQCHTKLMLFTIGTQHTLVTGSANLTRRNIGGYNLETNVVVASHQEIAAIRDARVFFEELWTNAHGRTYTTSYETFADDSLVKTFVYRIQERVGVSSF